MKKKIVLIIGMVFLIFACAFITSCAKECDYCDGTGICPYCHGSRYGSNGYYCVYCWGSGNCRECDGTGKIK